MKLTATYCTPQLVCKYEEKAFPNIWFTVLKSKKWRQLNSLVNSTNLEVESGSDKETEPAECPAGMEFPSSAQESFAQGHTKTQKMARGRPRSAKARRHRRQRGGPGECHPEEVIFPPYTTTFSDEDSTHPSAEPVSEATFSSLQSDSIDVVNTGKHGDGNEQTPGTLNVRLVRNMLDYVHNYTVY